MALRSTPSEKQDIINSLTEATDHEDKEWYREYMTRNFEMLVRAVEEKNPVRYGFRSLEMQEELQRRGLFPSRQK